MIIYPSDLTDKQWEMIKHNFEYGNYGKSRKYPVRTPVNAVFYTIKTGCQWRMLPKDFPTYLTVYSFYRRCRIKGIWEKMMRELAEKSRVAQGRNPNPSYSLIDSQSVKTTSASEKRGIDGGKKDKGA
jgi:putative transposase